MRQDPFEDELREQRRRRRGNGPGHARGRGWVWGGYWGYGGTRVSEDVTPGDDGDHLGDQFGGGGYDGSMPGGGDGGGGSE